MDDSSSLIRQTIPDYRLIAEIGSGGMGVVFRTYDQQMDHEVALDVFSPGRVTDEAGCKHLRKEALAHSRLNHPNRATIYDFDTQGSIDFLVMEYIPEQILCGRLIKREEKCSTSQKLLRELKNMRSLFGT